MAVDISKREVDQVEAADMADTEKAELGVVAPTEQEIAAVNRKLDLHLMPIIFVIYMLSVLDRSNLGNAHTAGMDKDIGLVGNQYADLGTIFYVGYIVFQWTTIGWKQFPAHIWTPLIILSWSTLSTCQAAVQSFGGLAAVRFLLGACETMYSGVPVYLSFFYGREKVGFRQGLFLSGSAAANAYGGALGYGILLIKGRIASWRILFLIEGLPTLIMVVLAFFFLPDNISKARFLTEREKEIAIYSVRRGQVADVEHHEGIRWKELLSGLYDWRSYVMGILYFSCNVSFASLPLFVPTIIGEIGTFGKLQSNGLSAPPYLLTFILIIIVAIVSDRVGVRGPFVSAFGFVSAIGFILLATTEGPAPRYLGVYLAITIFVSVALAIAWVTNMNSTESKRAGGWIIFGMFGQCGPLLGTNLFPASEAPYYRKGSWVSTAFCLVVAFTAAGLSWSLWRENKKLDRIFADEQPEGEGADRTRPSGFRYVI